MRYSRPISVYGVCLPETRYAERGMRYNRPIALCGVSVPETRYAEREMRYSRPIALCGVRLPETRYAERGMRYSRLIALCGVSVPDTRYADAEWPIARYIAIRTECDKPCGGNALSDIDHAKRYSIFPGKGVLSSTVTYLHIRSRYKVLALYSLHLQYVRSKKDEHSCSG